MNRLWGVVAAGLLLSGCVPGISPPGAQVMPASTAAVNQPTVMALVTPRPSPIVSATATPSGTVIGLVGGSTDSECIDLKDGRSCDPRTSLGQSLLSVPMYRDTGVGKREVFQIPNIPAEYTLIAGGVRVNGYNQGSISAWVGPSQAMTLDITDGFYHIVVSGQAEGETCARVAQHIRENWLLTRLNVPAQWRSNCPAIASLLK